MQGAVTCCAGGVAGGSELRLVAGRACPPPPALAPLLACVLNEVCWAAT